MSETRLGVLITTGVILLFIGGCVLVGLGLRYAYDAPAAEYTGGAPICDGKVMRPGDSCTVFSGPGDSGTYEEIIAEREKNAKADAWAGAEITGGIGAVLMFVGAGLAGGILAVRNLSRRVITAVTLFVFSLPLTAVAVTLWPLHTRTQAESEVPVGFQREFWDTYVMEHVRSYVGKSFSVPPTPALTFAIAVLGTVLILRFLRFLRRTQEDRGAAAAQ